MAAEKYSYSRTAEASYSKTVGNGDDEKAAYGYTAIALAQAVTAGALLLKPQEAARFLLGATALPTNAEQDRLFGLLAATALTTGATAWALRGSANAHTLASEDSERLQLGIMALGAASLAVHLAHGSDLSDKGKAAGTVAAAVTFAVPAARLLGNQAARGRAGNRLKGAVDSVARLFDFRRGFKLTSTLYGLVTPAFFIAGAAYLVSPQKTLGNLLGYVLKGNDSVFLWRQAGGALLTVLPAVTHTLKEKADRGELGDGTAKTLNTGLLLSSLGSLVILGPMAQEGTGGKYLPALVGTWAAALFASASGLASSTTAKAV